MWLVILGLMILGGSGGVWAENYVTIVNPVRERERWKENNLELIVKQNEAIGGLPATWLVSYGVLDDKDLVETIRSFGGEAGGLMEVDESLAREAVIPREINRPWYDPGVVFLSGYERSQRKKMIDRMFDEFKRVWGKYPESVGAWWIDSYSLRYMREKYKIKTAMIVADQKTTDNYGVWGQWWSVPYRASMINPQIPTENGLPIIQWAMRDPVRAYGDEGYKTSNYSVQANDYLAQGLDVDYFKKVAGVYLAAENKINQLTVGLEAGQEAVGNLGELEKQTNWLKSQKIKTVTMSEFGKIIGERKEAVVDGWKMNLEGRGNESLGEKIIYPQNISWGDEFVADKSSFLARNLNDLKNKNIKYIPYWIGVMVITGLAVRWKRGWRRALVGILMTLLLWWPVWKSVGQWGWWVYYGPVVKNLMLAQMVLAVVGVIVFSRVKIEAILALGLATILNYARVTVIEGKIHAGFLIDGFRLIGLNSKQFEGWVTEAMLKFRWEWVWGKWWMWLIVYPMVIMFLGKIIEKLPRGIKIVVGVLLMIYVRDLLSANPVAVEAMR